MFDFDGTLFDSIRGLSEAEVNAVKEMGWKPITLDYAKGTIGLSLSTIYENLTGDKTHSKLDEFTARFNNYFFKKVPEIGFFSGIEEMLLKLKDHGFILTIATGKGRQSLDRLDSMLKFERFFAANIGPNESAPKPDPLMVYKLLEKFGLKPEEAVVIGDSEHDMRMAANAGVDAIAVTYGASGEEELKRFNPIAIAHSVNELEQILLKM